MVVHLFIGMIVFFQNDGNFLAFDRMKEKGILINHLKFIDHYVLSYGQILTGSNMSGSNIW